MRPVIHSKKHLVQYPLDQILASTTQLITLISGVETPTTSVHVEQGSSIKAVHVELWLQNEGNLAEQIVTLEKLGQGNTGVLHAEMSALYDYDNKKNILFTHQGLSSNDGISGPQRIMADWYKIPKGKQRFGLGDKLVLNISNVSASDLLRCGVAIYKEYS